MNLPNKLTLLRIILIPVFMVVLYWGFPGATYVALAIFIIASLTDMLDGKIARKYNLVTDFGKFADPLADKMLVTAAMLWFVEIGQMPAWMLLIVIVPGVRRQRPADDRQRQGTGHRRRLVRQGQDCLHHGVRGADVPAHSTGGEHALRVGHHPDHPVLRRGVLREEQGCHRLGCEALATRRAAGGSLPPGAFLTCSASRPQPVHTRQRDSRATPPSHTASDIPEVPHGPEQVQRRDHFPEKAAGQQEDARQAGPAPPAAGAVRHQQTVQQAQHQRRRPGSPPRARPAGGSRSGGPKRKRFRRYSPAMTAPEAAYRRRNGPVHHQKNERISRATITATHHAPEADALLTLDGRR